MKNYKRAKIIEKIIRQTYDSLQSHLRYTYTHTSEGQKFHIDCVKEYIEIIKNASELY
jgi:hypothetical protein